jgi:hypothetical protein
MNNEDINKDNTNFSGEEGNFGLPENYFDSFSAKLFKKMAAEDELKEYPLLSSVQKNNPFGVPASYFESKEALFDYPLLVSLKKNNPFAVPATYFETKEELFQYPLLLENKARGFRVPDVYFDTLAERINHTISIEEEKEAYPLLYSYNNGAVFRMPDLYFEEFEANVLSNRKEPTVVVPLYERFKLSYKVAAAIALFMGLGILFYMQQEKTVIQKNDCNTFACLDKNDILNSGYVSHISLDNIIDMMDETTLSDTLLLKKNGKTQKVQINDVSDNVDINTLTDNL